MDGFEDGYEYFSKDTAGIAAGVLGNQYVNTVNSEIDGLVNSINNMKGFNTDVAALKGDVAEYWHSGTFNIDAAVKGSSHRAIVDRSHDFASKDVSTNFDNGYGLKYYKTGVESAKQQAKSIFDRFREYQSHGGKDTIDEFLGKRGYTEDTILSDPIYSGQLRLIPSDQLKDAVSWLERRIHEETAMRPEQVKRYQETLSLLRDKIQDAKGNYSIPLTREDAEKLARLAKKGSLDPSELGLTTEELIKYEYILKQAFKAGLTAATITMVLKVAPEIFRATEYLIKSGEIDEKQFKRIGFAALEGASEGFVRGTIAAAITTYCKSGILGSALKDIDPTIVGAVTVLVINTMKNSFNVATGKMTKRELSNELIKEMFTTTCALATGTVSQALIEVPVLGFMIGSFVGSLAGSFVYHIGYSTTISFCVDTGFTMFGLVDQKYELPKDVMREIGIDVFDYEKFVYTNFELQKFEYIKFQADSIRADSIDFYFLRRGVIGISQIGFVE